MELPNHSPRHSALCQPPLGGGLAQAMWEGVIQQLLLMDFVYFRMGSMAAASASFWACASARSLPSVVK